MKTPDPIEFEIPSEWDADLHLNHPLVLRFIELVHDPVEDPAPLEDGDDDPVTAAELLDETHWHGLTIGFAMAHGLNASQAYRFATFIRYDTDMG